MSYCHGYLGTANLSSHLHGILMVLYLSRDSSFPFPGDDGTAMLHGESIRNRKQRRGWCFYEGLPQVWNGIRRLEDRCGIDWKVWRRTQNVTLCLKQLSMINFPETFYLYRERDRARKKKKKSMKSQTRFVVTLNLSNRFIGLKNTYNQCLPLTESTRISACLTILCSILTKFFAGGTWRHEDWH